MLALGQKLATLSSQYGMPEFREKYLLVENIIHLLEDNISFTVVPNSEAFIKVCKVAKHIQLFCFIVYRFSTVLIYRRATYL